MNFDQKKQNALLESMRLDVMEIELKARRQAALTSLKRDFIEECNISDEYTRLYKLEQEKYADYLRSQSKIEEVKSEVEDGLPLKVEEVINN